MTLVVPVGAALAQTESKAAPLFVSSYGNTTWKSMQAATRPWSREEMLSAVPADVRGVNEDTLRRWAAEAMVAAQYDTKGGPGFSPGAGPADAPVVDAVQSTLVEAPVAGLPLAAPAYSYPPPYTRYESFPSTATAYSTYPYITVGRVFFTEPGVGNFSCSAASIGGDAVITAGHCVHSGKNPDDFFVNWVFVPGTKNGSAPYGQWAADHLWITKKFIDGLIGDSRYDVGGAVLKRKVGVKISQKVGFLGFAWNVPYPNVSAHFAVIGYPANPPFTGQSQQVCQASYAYTAIGKAPNPIGVGCDQTGGTSGGPWIRSFSGVKGGAVNNNVNGVSTYRRCYDPSCNSVYAQELFSPYFDTNIKNLQTCLVNSVPGNPANPDTGCPPGS